MLRAPLERASIAPLFPVRPGARIQNGDARGPNPESERNAPKDPAGAVEDPQVPRRKRLRTRAPSMRTTRARGELPPSSDSDPDPGTARPRHAARVERSHLGLCLCLSLQTSGIQMQWSDTEDDPTHATMEWASAVAFSPLLDLYVAGTQSSPCRAVARKYDALGNVVWCRVFDWGPQYSESEGLLIVRGPDGNLIAAGTIEDSLSPTHRDIVVTKIDEGTGVDVWTHFVRLDGRAHDDDVPQQIVVDAAGDIYLAAHLQDFAPYHLADIGLYKISGRSGGVLWHTRLRSTLGGTGLDLDDQFAEMALTNNGCLLVAGTLTQGDSGGGTPYFSSPLFYALDCGAGLARQVPIPVPFANVSLCNVAVEPLTGKVVLAGTTFSGVDLDLFVARFSSSWNLEWYSSFSPTGVANECLRGADIAPNGDVVVVGTSNAAADMQWFTFKYHFASPPPLGSLVMPVWGRYFRAGAQPNGFDVPLGIRFDPAGNMAIAGVAEVTPGGPHKMVDLRYSSSGVTLLGTPAFATGWISPGADIISGWSFDKLSGASAMAGLVRTIEPGSAALLTDWAVFRSGP
jgi:hypothetical protein